MKKVNYSHSIQFIMPVSKNPKRHGKRYSESQKSTIIKATKDKTWDQVEKKYDVSQQSMARWKKGHENLKKDLSS